MSSPNIEIHEFSTGIHVQERANGWVSLGFTGQYMNATINPIPPVVERSIANQEFALTEGSSTEKPAIIGRIVGGGDDVWSVMAVVTRGQDEMGRSAAFYRYFLCQGDHNLRFILAWWEQNQKPTFNPLDFQGSPFLFMGESGQPHLTKEDESLPFAQDQAIVLPVENQHDLYTLNALAITKFNKSKNGLPVAWAFNVEALEKPERFQVIQPASQKAYEILKRAIANAGQVVSAINVDEAALKSAIRSLINSSTVKPEVVEEIVKGLENKEVTAEYWEKLFNAQGAQQAIRQKIYSPQMVRLITLRAMVNPKTLPQFLAWLNIQGGKKPDQHQTISLELQKAIRGLLPKEQLAKGIKYLLLDLLNQKISVDSLCWLLTTNGSAWVYAQRQFIADIQADLQLIDDHFSSPKTTSKSSSYSNPNSVFTRSSSVGSENDSQLHHLQPPIKKDSWQNDFKCQKQIWATLINSWQGIRQGYYRGEEYQPFAELFKKFRQYDLAAYFYQVSDGIVDKDLYYEVANQQHRRSPVVFGLRLEPKKNLIDHVLDFITQEYIVPIQFVIPLSLLILVSGWFIGAKNWESYTDKTDIEKSLCSKTFEKDDKNKDIKNCQVIVLNPGYSFSEIKQLIPAVVDDVVKDKKREEDNKPGVKKTEEDIKKQVLKKLEGLIGSTGLQYNDLNPGKQTTDLKIQKQWVTAIYNYQITNKVEYQKIADKGSEDNKCNLPFGICLWLLGQNNDTSDGVNEKDSELYQKLKGDILKLIK
jgi:methionine salvage enolase-phosphatase E1